MSEDVSCQMFRLRRWAGGRPTQVLYNLCSLVSEFDFTFLGLIAVPVAVFILGVAAGLEVMSCRMLLIMSVISFGVLVASYGEININWVGVIYQMGGVVGEALRLIFMEILVKRKGLKLNPISVMYYVSPCRQVPLSSESWNNIMFCFNVIERQCERNCLVTHAVLFAF